MEEAAHPYVPRDLKLPGYVPISMSMSTILAVYLGASLLVVSLVWLLLGRKKAKVEKLLMCWWAFTGLTHIILEGYFVFTPEFFKDNTSCYLAEVWKEYSKGDSRYAGRDSAIVSIEGITAVIVGPVCLLAIYAIAKEKSYSYVLQLAISLGQLYGCLVYFITAILEGDNFATNSFYYYSYYIGANGWWILIPLLISFRCWKKICAAVANNIVETKTKTKKKLR
ncbi:PREDICTED: probable 3-beta-hydroxysteroid-Delta(8),Delta(7)-isomerase [Camelina sativa]|uniref:Probable 3-beta-hydroxysteroid-Delta(8),Delta(7)-isomerase n=1 Tax=Camelina sativa TaxID=90675 RepID=A0ABM0WWN4_CAMSA|nr:PREDICTED: probable 3-beta-hydroxysteroid-Delta(8),Delta(7)-isomerase [Camelina sativa]